MLTSTDRMTRPDRPSDIGAACAANPDVLLRLAVDQLRSGVIFADRAGYPIFANREARTILAAGDGLHERSCSLHAETAELTRRLRRIIESAVEVTAAPSVMALTRRVRPHPLSLEARPLSDGIALLLIVDPDRASMPAPERLRRLYGLTDAEAAVAVAVARGAGLSAAAAQLDIGLNTARTHLQRVFQKTHTRRQAQLVRLIVGGFG